MAILSPVFLPTRILLRLIFVFLNLTALLEITIIICYNLYKERGGEKMVNTLELRGIDTRDSNLCTRDRAIFPAGAQ